MILDLTITEENYLKALFKIGVENGSQEVGTNELASSLSLKPATVNNMLKKLKEKKLINHEKYGKIKLTSIGKKHGVEVIRKHRLWETFLYEKLEFGWDEIHEVAEQLEHVRSQKLIDKLEKFLDFPEFDPHGDPIPDHEGHFKTTFKRTLSDIEPKQTCKMVAVKDNSSSFLQYVVKLGLGLHNQIKVLHKHEFDGSLEIEVHGVKSVVSHKFATNILVVGLEK